jgi:hypothetical protein
MSWWRYRFERVADFYLIALICEVGIEFLIYASCDETIQHLNFIKDTHKLDENELISLMDDYNFFGSKINKFIRYVEIEWR